MNALELGFFGICALFVIVGGIATVGARNPIRGAMGLLASIIGIAGMYLGLAAEFLAAVQIIVYAGAVVVLFLFVIMLLGPSATSPRDARSAIPRYAGAAIFLASAGAALVMFIQAGGRAVHGGPTAFAEAPPTLGTIEAVGRELFTRGIVPFELSGALLLIAVVGAVAVARGKQIDPTMLAKSEAVAEKGSAHHAPSPREAASRDAVGSGKAPDKELKEATS